MDTRWRTSDGLDAPRDRRRPWFGAGLRVRIGLSEAVNQEPGVPASSAVSPSLRSDSAEYDC